MSKILAITVYAGSEKLVEMTERMLRRLPICDPSWHVGKDHLHVVAVGNGAVRMVGDGRVDSHLELVENVGFGNAVNLAIRDFMNKDVTDVLVLNNDLEFPYPEWLAECCKERDGKRIISPLTDRTATAAAKASGPRNQDPVLASQVSAFCWLVPRSVIELLRKKFGFPLFDPDFFAYGEDDYTSAILRKHVDPRPFKVVPRAWVRHLKHQTGKEFGLGGGMKRNLKLLHKKMKAHGLR